MNPPQSVWPSIAICPHTDDLLNEPLPRSSATSIRATTALQSGMTMKAPPHSGRDVLGMAAGESGHPREDSGETRSRHRRFPYAEHRYCACHLYVNFSDKFNRGRALKNMFWPACKATNKGAFDDAMATFREKGDKYMTPEGLTPLEWMHRRGLHSWCKYYFETLTTCDISLNNQCESFNRWILEARDMPIISCLQAIRDPIEPYYDPCYTIGNYRFAYGNSINPLNDASQWPDSFGPQLKPPTIEKPMSGPRQKKRMLEAGELVTKKDKKGKSYKTIRRTDEKQKCSVCKKIGHNKRAQGSGGVSIIFYRSNCVNNAWIQ
ncbi:hypothetical protein LINPERHAP1_LOCUS34314 [Linum perenne]